MKLGVNPYNFTSIIRELFVTNNPTRSNSWKTLALVDFFLPFFFFFDMERKRYIKKRCQKSNPKYTIPIHPPPKRSKEEKKNSKQKGLKQPQQEPNQSTKLIKIRG